jgi:hypothetical protein
MTMSNNEKLAAYSRLGISCSVIGEDFIVHGDEKTITELGEALKQHHFDELRAERDRLLAASDWTVLSDSPTSTAAWKTYRQALRDLPANTTDPSNPVWPTPPS